MNDPRTGAPISRNPSKPIAYESQVEFYEASHADTIVGKLSLSESATMVHCEQRAGDWSDAPTRDLVISVIESGRGEHSVDLGAGRFRGMFRSGQALVIAPAAGSSLERSARHSLWGVNLRYSWLREFAGEGLELPATGDFGRLHAGPIEDELLVALHRSFRKTPARPPERLFTDRAILLFAARLDQLARSKKSKNPPAPTLSDWQLRRSTDALEATLRQGISLPALARLTGLSTFHFARAFKNATGVAPHRYQIHLRIERAKELLAETVSPVGDIGAAVGYDDVGYFAKVFARHVGVTPPRYRARRRA